jgi:hypothetical protein
MFGWHHYIAEAGRALLTLPSVEVLRQIQKDIVEKSEKQNFIFLKEIINYSQTFNRP